MLIAIGILALVVVFMASKSDPGQSTANGLPNPPSIPATGTTGVPSPATHPGGHAFGTPLLGTNAGQLVLQTNFQAADMAWHGNPPLPSSKVVSSAPTSVPLQQKELFTGVKNVQPGIKISGAVPPGYQKL